MTLKTLSVIIGALALLSGCDKKSEHGSPETRVVEYLKYQFSDPEKAIKSLTMAAQSGHTEARIRLSSLLIGGAQGIDFSPFGANRNEAVSTLLRSISDKSPKARYLLAIHLMDKGDPADLTEVRQLFESCSELPDTWFYLSKMYHQGLGGEIDLKSAYFFYSALCFTSAPGSPVGENSWKMRDSLANEIGTFEARKLIQSLDEHFITHGTPTLTMAEYASDSDRYTKADIKRIELEEKHRSQLGIAYKYKDPFD